MPQSRRVQQSVILHFCGGLSQSGGEAPGSFRTGAGAHCVPPVVATNWCEGPYGSVTPWQILSAPTFAFISLFSIAKSYLVDPANNHNACLRD